jgi:hypothetical protein
LNLTFRLISLVCLAVALCSVAATAAMNYLTIIAANAGCADRADVHGYDIDIARFWFEPVFCAVALFMVWQARKSLELRDIFHRLDLIIIDVGPLKLTVGAVIAYSCIVGPALMGTVVAVYSSTRYEAISSYCRTPTGLHASLMPTVTLVYTVNVSGEDY